MSSEILVRPVDLSDFTEWKVLWEEFNAHLDRAVEHEATDRTWNRFFDTNSRTKAVVALKDGKVLGFAHFVFDSNLNRAGSGFYLQDLFTHESDRSDSTGRALVDAVQIAVGQMRVSNVDFQTLESNRPGIDGLDRIVQLEDSCIYRRESGEKRRRSATFAVTAAIG